MPTEADVQTPHEGLRIGQQIRDLRKAKGVTLVQMAEAIGRSTGYVSQVERGVSALPIPVLQKICQLLDVSISWFFHTDKQPPAAEVDVIVRRDDRRSLSFTGTGISEQLLSPKMSGSLLLIEMTLDPGAGSDSRQRKGEEAGVVKSGQLELGIGEQNFLLQPGDSFSLTGDKPHWIRNPSDTESTVVFWTITGGAY